MIGKDEIAEVVRYNDAEAEEFEDIPRYWGGRGVDPAGLSYVAMQRGLRVCMIMKGLNPNQTKRFTVTLNQREQDLQVKFAGCFMDGFAAGWEAREKHGDAAKS